MENSFNKIKIGVVGLGQRGRGLLDTLLAIDVFEIVAVCDCYQDRVDKAFEMITKQQLVDTYEKTKTPIMFLENCCYNSFELLATHLARKNMFGEIVRCHGAYSHDLRAQILGGNVNRHYLLKLYRAELRQLSYAQSWADCKAFEYQPRKQNGEDGDDGIEGKGRGGVFPYGRKSR